MPISYQSYSIVDVAGPFRADTVSYTSESAPQILGLSNGGFVTGFQTYSLPEAGPPTINNTGLDFYYGRTYYHTKFTYADPTPSGTGFDHRAMTQLTNGNVLVVWEDVRNNVGEIHGRIYDQLGNDVAGGELNLTYGVATAGSPSVTAGPNGTFQLTWSDLPSSGHGQNTFVAGYSAAGYRVFVSQASRADTDNTLSYEKSNQEGSVSELAGGGFVVTYNHTELVTGNGPDPTDDNHYDVRAVIYNDNGTIRVPDFLIEFSDDGVDPELVSAALPGGNFAVVYVNDRLGGEGGTTGLTMRIVTPTGGIGASIHVNTPTTGNGSTYDGTVYETNPQITVLANGFILVTWENKGNAESFGRVFDEQGTAITPQFELNDPIGKYGSASVAHLLDGQFATVWTVAGALVPGSTTQTTGQTEVHVQEIVRTTVGTAGVDDLGGDEIRDLIQAGGGADRVHAGGGNDLISGDDGNDMLFGEDGDDEIFGGANDDRLEGGKGNDTLRGDSGYDTLIGGDGNDDLNGGADFDTLAGSLGDDSYTLDSGSTHDAGDGLFVFSFDTVTENAGEGTDVVFVQRVQGNLNLLANYILTANVENGVILGTGAFNLTGNASANALTGNGAANTLNGRGGADTLYGGGGADKFVFDSNALTDAQSAIFDTIFDYDRSAGAFNTSEGDQIDLSAILSGAYNHGSGQPVASLVRAVEDASGIFAYLQVDTDGAANGANWLTVARINGVQINNTLNVILDSTQPSGSAISVSAGTVAINDVAVTEGNSGTKLANFTVTRSGGTAAFDVNFATADGSATLADGDYVANSGTLHFGAGVNTQTFSVTINGDTKIELSEAFSVNLSAVTNGFAISDGLGFGTISNDDFQFMPITAQIHAFAPGPDGWSSNDRFPRELADVNGDGNADIVGFGGAGVYVSLATGTGSFGSIALKSHDFGSEPSAGGWASDDKFPRLLADINGDHIADIVGFGGAGAYVALGTASGTFGAIALGTHDFGTEPSAGGWINETKFPRELADVNGDGKADIVGFGGAGVYVALATGNGSFGAIKLASNDFGTEASAGGWVNDDKFPRQLADVNGDGKADIVGFGGDGVYVALATSNGSFGAIKLASHDFGTEPAAGGWTSYDRFPRELADVNGDGKVDIVGFGGAGTYIAYGNGDGSFKPLVADLQAFGTEAGGGGWVSEDRYPRHLADVNHDGSADIVGFGYDGVYEALSNGFHLV